MTSVAFDTVVLNKQAVVNVSFWDMTMMSNGFLGVSLSLSVP